MNILPQIPTLVKLHPEIAVRAIKDRLDFPYKLWTFLRMISVAENGSGLFPWAEVEQLVCNKYKIMSRTTLYRCLRDDKDNVFLVRSGPYLKLNSLRRVSVTLQIRPSQSVLVTLERLKGVAVFRATCLESMFAHEKSLDRVITLSKLAELTNRSERTVWGWLKKIGIHVEHNALKSTLPPTEPTQELVAQGWYRSTQKDGTVEMRRRLPNSYSSDLKLAPKGRTRKVRRHIPRQQRGGALVSFIAARKNSQKGRKVVNRLKENETAYILWRPPVKRDSGGIAGARLWEGFSRANGELYTQ